MCGRRSGSKDMDGGLQLLDSPETHQRIHENVEEVPLLCTLGQREVLNRPYVLEDRVRWAVVVHSSEVDPRLLIRNSVSEFCVERKPRKLGEGRRNS